MAALVVLPLPRPEEREKDSTRFPADGRGLCCNWRLGHLSSPQTRPCLPLIISTYPHKNIQYIGQSKYYIRAILIR